MNEYKKPSTVKEKSDNSGILKGIYEGYFSGENCTKTAEYLPFDIDVKNSDKPKENKHLLNPVKNEIIFKELQKQSGLC